LRDWWVRIKRDPVGRDFESALPTIHTGIDLATLLTTIPSRHDSLDPPTRTNDMSLRSFARSLHSFVDRFPYLVFGGLMLQVTHTPYVSFEPRFSDHESSHSLFGGRGYTLGTSDSLSPVLVLGPASESGSRAFVVSLMAVPWAARSLAEVADAQCDVRSSASVPLPTESTLDERTGLATSRVGGPVSPTMICARCYTERTALGAHRERYGGRASLRDKIVRHGLYDISGVRTHRKPSGGRRGPRGGWKRGLRSAQITLVRHTFVVNVHQLKGSYHYLLAHSPSVDRRTHCSVPTCHSPTEWRSAETPAISSSQN